MKGRRNADGCRSVEEGCQCVSLECTIRVNESRPGVQDEESLRTEEISANRRQTILHAALGLSSLHHCNGAPELSEGHMERRANPVSPRYIQKIGKRSSQSLLFQKVYEGLSRTLCSDCRDVVVDDIPRYALSHAVEALELPEEERGSSSCCNAGSSVKGRKGDNSRGRDVCRLSWGEKCSRSRVLWQFP